MNGLSAHVVLFGATGRIGSSIFRLLENLDGLKLEHFVPGCVESVVDSSDATNVLFILAVPWNVAQEMVTEIEALERREKRIVVLDCSGFVKRSRLHSYALDDSFCMEPNKNLLFVGNAGCIASACIQTLHDLQFVDGTAGISVVATGSVVFVWMFAC